MNGIYEDEIEKREHFFVILRVYYFVFVPDIILFYLLGMIKKNSFIHHK